MLESDTSSKAEVTVIPISWGRAGFHKVMHVKLIAVPILCQVFLKKQIDVPDGSVVQTLSFECKGCRFDPRWETKMMGAPPPKISR